jgi:Ser/Thr protein kinase RdoA (MazF antagonist)
MSADARHPYETLTPDVVLDALASVGLYGDGRLLGLSSYENRVYQVHLEDAFEGSAIVVAKFYRPARWSEQQILEEHAFAAELMQAEVPAVAPFAVAGGTLHQHGGFLFSVSPRRGGRSPELDDGEVLEWIGRYLARLHIVGARQPFESRPALDIATFGEEPRDWLLQHDAIPLDVQGDWQRMCELALAQIRAAFASAREAGVRMLRLHGDCHPGTILWPATSSGRPMPGRTSSTSTTRAPAPRCRTCGCWFRESAHSASGSWGPCSMAMNRCASSTGPSWR